MTFQIIEQLNISIGRVRVQLLDENKNIIIDGWDFEGADERVKGFLQGLDFAKMQYSLIDYKGELMK